MALSIPIGMGTESDEESPIGWEENIMQGTRIGYTNSESSYPSDHGHNSIRCLCTAILERAIRDIFASGCEPHVKRDARRWLFDSAPTPDPDPLSYFGICEMLSLNPTEIRQKIKHLLETGQKIEYHPILKKERKRRLKARAG